MADKKPPAPTRMCSFCEQELPLTDFVSFNHSDGSKRHGTCCERCWDRDDGNMFDSYMPRSGPSQDPSYM